MSRWDIARSVMAHPNTSEDVRGLSTYGGDVPLGHVICVIRAIRVIRV